MAETKVGEKRKPGPPPGVRHGGRQKGTPNKLTVNAREAFQHAFDEMGGPAQLAAWARMNETEFYKLFARLIPVQQEHSGKDGQPLVILTGVPRANAD
jgi:hypothetical protein